MAQSFDWDQALFSPDTGDFDRALVQIRRNAAIPAASPALLANLAIELREKPGITRREFDRRFRLIVSAVIEHNPAAISAIAIHLSQTSPEALNSVRTLLPPEMRHLAIQHPVPSYRPAKSVPPTVSARDNRSETAVGDTLAPVDDSKFRAVILIGTAKEHGWNERVLQSNGLDPLLVPTLEEFWNIARSEMCGFVVGSSAWEEVPPAEQRDAVHRICEHSTFLFVRVSLLGLAPAIAQTFAQSAAAARCGPLDAKRFCYGQNCDITLADIPVLLSIAQLQEKASGASFYPLGLSESDTSLLRLIAADRHPSAEPVAIHRIGTRELAGGKSAARVFHLSDGLSHPFIAKVDNAKELHAELDRYQRWIQSWEQNGTSPMLYAHQGSAAIAYRLQAAPDGNGQPAPTLEAFLERVCAMEWTASLEATRLKASDVLLGVGRAVDRLVDLNSRSSGGMQGDDFWLDWPVRSLAERGIETTVINQGWETLELSSVTRKAMCRLGPNLTRGVIHGDIHGRNILLLDRTPAFIDFRWSGPGHPLVDLVRLDATVRTIAMRMSLPKQSMFQAFESLYVDGQSADQVLADHPSLAKSPLTSLAICVAARVRKAAIEVARIHSMDVVDFWAMSCIVAGHVLAVRSPGSAVERLLLGVLAPRL